VPNLSQGLPPLGASAFEPANWHPFKFQPPHAQPPRATDSTGQLLHSPLVAPLPLAEPSFSITPYAAPPLDCNNLNVHTVAVSDASPLTLDDCKTPDHAAIDAAQPFSSGIAPLASMQPPNAPSQQRSAFHLLFSARTSSTPSPGPDSSRHLAETLDEQFPDSAADGSVGGWPAEEYSLHGERVEPSLGHSSGNFHTVEELAGQFATMQVHTSVRHLCLSNT
jgi:hypothetical protein